MTTFQDRLEQAAKLEEPFIRIFNEQCATHQVVKFGVESTHVSEFHGLVRYADDPTSHFLRYLPDSVVIRKDDEWQVIGPKTVLVEFKVQDTLLYSDSFFRTIQDEYGDNQPPLLNKHDIFAMERDSLALYERLASAMGVPVVLVALQSPRRLLRAQYADEIVVPHRYTPRGGGRGSGTPAANTHFGTYEDASDFFEREFGIERIVLDSIKDAVTNAT